MRDAAIIRRIDEALRAMPGISSGLGDYAAAMEAFEQAGRGAAALQALRAAVVDLTARRYWSRVRREVELLELSDGTFDILYDRTLDRPLLVHRLTPRGASDTRDAARRHPALPGFGTGDLRRGIETYLAAYAGLFAFVRLIYAPGNEGAAPDEAEYGLLNGNAQFRAVVFPNR